MIDGIQQTRSAHRLIAEAAYGACPDGMECCHINGQVSDNRASNLKWASSSENNGLDKKRLGRLRVGSAHQNSVLTERNVVEVRSRRKAGEGLSEIAKDMGVSKTTIWRICQNKAWRTD